MTFRRLYWIAEELGNDGKSTVTGVYTSIADLVHKGLKWRNGAGSKANFRLTLVKPDTFDAPLGRWDASNLDGIEEAIAPFMATNEISIEESKMLCEGLAGFFSGAHA